MFLRLACATCVHNSHPPDLTLYRVEVQDSGFHKLTCKHGHKTATCLQALRFEVLSELAANAIADGYYREAISSFTSALERFYEFYATVICRQRKLDPIVFAETWKHVSRQSERQFGAFLFLYALERNEKPPVLNPKLVELRNDVVHKGLIPNRQQAMAYGQAVIDLIAPIIAQLKSAYDEDITKIVVSQLIATQTKYGAGETISTMAMATAIAIVHQQQPLTKTLERLAMFKPF